jgi:hypothetical protein
MTEPTEGHASPDADAPRERRYDPTIIEPKWQAFWDEHEPFRTTESDDGRPSAYILDMFPYPSGSGLHVGHPEGYTATDIVARYKRSKGFDVLHPMGWDAFGLPAEQYAIQTGTHPRDTTAKNIETFKRQLKMLGFSYDWRREIDTTDPGYVKWTQWIFLTLFERGLAFQSERPVNWCPALGTVLANEEVIDGLSERGNHPVLRVPVRQWMLRITAYADKLLEGLSLTDWPESTRVMQQEWIGRSEGAEARFAVEGHDGVIEVYTTRPDTLFGATFVVLAPDHPLVETITTDAQRAAVVAYASAAKNKSDRDRQANKEKTGVFTGAFAINPVSGDKVPVWIADYVLLGYGTGAIMAVPAHDERDFAFAKAFSLPIIEVVSADGKPTEGGLEAATPCTRHLRELGPVQRPDDRGGEGAHHEGPRSARPRQGARRVQAPRLGLLASALLGRADPDLLPRRDERRPDQGRRAHDSLRPADSRSRAKSSRSACPTSRTSSPAKTRRACSRARPTGASSRRTASGSRARPTRCRSGRARVGTTCASATRPTTRQAGAQSP